MELNVDDKGDMLNRAVCLAVTFHTLGIKRKVSSEAIETDAKKKMLHVTKDILESNALKKLNTLDNKVRFLLRSRCLPFPLKDGVYLLPNAILTEIYYRIEEYKGQRKLLVKDFLGEYQTAKEEAEKSLGSLFNLDDYPDVEDVAEAFSLETKCITFKPQGELRDIDPSIWEREMSKFKSDISSATDEIKAMLRASLLDLTNHLVEKLGVKPDGSKQIFKDVTVTKIKEFLDTFQSRNIVDDSDLAKLVEQAKGILTDVSPELLRTNEAMRDKVQKDFEGIKQSLDTMLVDRPKRRFNLDD